MESLPWTDNLILELPVPVVIRPTPMNMLNAMEIVMAIHTGYPLVPEYLNAIATIISNSPYPFCLPHDGYIRDFYATFEECHSVFPAIDSLSTELINHLDGFQDVDRQKITDHFTQQQIKITVNNKRFRDWYKDPQNLESSMIFFFGLICTELRILVKLSQLTYHHVQFRYYQQHNNILFSLRPAVMIDISAEIFNHLSEFFNQHHSFGRGIMKGLIILGMHVSADRPERTATGFFGYTVETPFKYHGFHLVKILDRVAMDYRGQDVSIIDLIELSGDPNVKAQFQNYLKMKRALLEMQRNPVVNIDGTEYRFALWPYSRFFEGACFLEIGVTKNQLLLLFCIGLLPEKDHGAKKMAGLSRADSEGETVFQKGRRLRAQFKNIPLIAQNASRPQTDEDAEFLNDLISEDKS